MENEKPEGEKEAILSADLLKQAASKRTSIVSKEGTIVNASGHRDQLQRQYGLWYAMAAIILPTSRFSS